MNSMRTLKRHKHRLHETVGEDSTDNNIVEGEEEAAYILSLLSRVLPLVSCVAESRKPKVPYDSVSTRS